jgi:hypothetical protein
MQVMMVPLSESPSSESNSTNYEPASEAYQQYFARLEQLSTPEEKIAHGLLFMRDAISQEGAPRFREFWEARKNTLPYFKQNLNPAIRSQLWSEYVELTVEARRLKEILEDQSRFAMEQIDLALASLEEEVGNSEARMVQSLGVELPEELEGKVADYDQTQRELNFLNTLAIRLNGLRKEVIATDMRIRFKTKFFKRIYALGDAIFPKRKELIEQVSAAFEHDVDRFIESHFRGAEVIGAPYYALREDIKALQGLAKQLTLNTNAFTKTRLKLSECWDKIKVLEKSYKQEFLQKKQAWSENYTALAAKIAELQGSGDLKALDAALDELYNEMRSMDLGKDEIWRLRQEMQALRTPFLTQIEEARKESERIDREKVQQKKEKTAALKERVAHLQSEKNASPEEIAKNLEEIRAEIERLSLSKFEQQQFERLLRPVKDMLAEKKESALLNLGDDEREALEQLRAVLQQRKDRRIEIKTHIDAYRKQLSGSGLDFEKAMMYREQMDLEKERLDKINASIVEIEEKISEIEENA